MLPQCGLKVVVETGNAVAKRPNACEWLVRSPQNFGLVSLVGPARLPANAPRLSLLRVKLRAQGSRWRNGGRNQLKQPAE
jgi:hypothetical protein